MRPHPLLLLVPVAAIAAAASSAQSPARVSYLAHPPQLAFAARETVPARPLRIVHAITGEPVPGAALYAIPEQAHPLPGTFEALARTVADADGIAFAPHRDAWLMARATGLGPTMFLGIEDDVLPLAPAVDVPIRPVDWLGRPLLGASFGFCGGCGHTSDLAAAYVGADGIAWFRDVDPHGSFADVYPSTAPVEFGYWGTHWVPGDAPEEFAYQRGAELHGTVLQPDGAPAKFALVGIYDKHRGPWTRTDREGRFRLFGLCEGDGFFVEHAGQKVECPWPEAMPCELRLPAPDGDPVQSLVPEPPDDPNELRVRVECVDPDGRVVDAGSWWTRDGRRYYARGRVREWLVPGRYRVRIEHPDHEIVEQEQVVTAEEGQTIRFVLPRLPTVRVVPSGLDDGTLAVVREDFGREFETPFGPIEVPVRPGETFAVQLRHTETQQSRWFRFDGTAALAAGEVRVAWYAPTRVTAQLVDERGEPVPADVKLLPRSLVLPRDGTFDPRAVEDLLPVPDGAVELASEQDRLCFLLVRPRAAALQPRLLAVPMPARSDDARVELGRVVLRATAQLVVQAPAGAERPERAQLLRAGYGDFLRGDLPAFPLDERGRWLGPDLTVGDGVLVPTAVPDTLPLRHVVRDLAPAVVAAPTGRLALRVRDPEGRAVAATVLVRECAFACDGELVLRQLPVGPCVVYVVAEGHRTARVEAEVPALGGAAATAPIEVVLPRH